MTFTAEESATHSRRTLDQSPEFGDAHFHEQVIGGAMTINPLHVLAVLTGMMTKTFSKIVANLAWEEQ